MAVTLSQGKHFNGGLDMWRAGQHEYVSYLNDKLCDQRPSLGIELKAIKEKLDKRKIRDRVSEKNLLIV